MLSDNNIEESEDYQEKTDTPALRLMAAAFVSLSQAYEDMADKDELFNGPHMYWFDAIEDKLDEMLYLQVLGNRRPNKKGTK